MSDRLREAFRKALAIGRGAMKTMICHQTAIAGNVGESRIAPSHRFASRARSGFAAARPLHNVGCALALVLPPPPRRSRASTGKPSD